MNANQAVYKFKKKISKKNSILLMMLIFLSDQFSKILVLNSINYGEIFHVTDFFNIVLTYNHGVTFGMLKAYSNVQFYVLSAAIVAVTILVFIWWIKAENKLQRYATSLIIAGALGNLCDRLRFRAVVDFLDFHINDWHWYAFNIADSAIVLGVILLFAENYLIKKTNLN
jgi:signal peptidase II